MGRTVAVLLAMSLASSAVADTGEPPRGQLPETVIPQHYRLALAIDPRQANFTGHAEIRVAVREPTQSIWLHGNGLTVARVTINAGRRHIGARYREFDGTLGVARLDLDQPLPVGEAVLRIDYAAPFQTAPQGLYRVQAGGEWYAFSQMEAIDARRVFPGFDEPRFKTPFDVTVTAPNNDHVVSNARLAASTATPNSTTRHRFARTRPLPTYLLTFAVGPLDIVEAPPVPPNDVRPAPLPLRFIATRGQGPALAFAVRETGPLVARLEAYFGIPFPYPKLDMIASPAHLGAMENSGAIVFSDNLLLFGATPTARQQSNFGITAAHEISHQWFGDLVTPAWWDDLWLNEAFAQWMGFKIADAWRPANAIASEQLSNTLEAMDVDALNAGRPIHQPIADSAQITDAFDEITYGKGAGVIGMVESYLGEERFRAGVRLHLARHMHGTATAQDFFGAMAEVAGEPAIIDAFRSFTDQAGVPSVTADMKLDGHTVSLAQTRYRPLGVAASPAPLSWKIPVCVSAYVDRTANKLCALLTEATGTLSLGAGPKPQAFLPNADGAGYYRFMLNEAALDALAASAARLPAREAIVLADSVGAAFDAGRLSFNALVRMARTLADHSDRTAALMLGYRLADIHDRVADEPARPGLERLLDGIYGPRLREIGFEPEAGKYATEPSDRQLLRRELVGIVGLWARDAEVRRVLAAAAQRSLDDPAALDPLLRSRAWGVGMRELSPAFRQAIETRLVGKDPQERQDAAVALGYAEESEASRQVRALILDPKVQTQSVFSLLYEQFQNPATRSDAWIWFNMQQSAVAARLPEGPFGQQFLAQMGAFFCTASERDAFQTALAPRFETVGDLALRRTIERIDVCIAVRAAHAAELATSDSRSH